MTDAEFPGGCTAHSVLVVGAGGLLGRALCKQYVARGTRTRPALVEWADDERAATDLAAAFDGLVASVGDAPWRVVWVAGAGVTSSSETALWAERRAQDAFLDAVARVPPSVRARGVVFYASSAGGVYAGSLDPPFTEATPPQPLAPYGRAKLESERAFSRLADLGVAVAIGRLANLYGPGQNLAKSQGLISQLSLSHHTAVPVNVYVSLDTLRDYLFVDDAAALVADLVETIAAAPGGPPVIKILASGRSVSVAALLGEINRVVKRRVPVVLAASPHARQQARDLRLLSRVLVRLDERPTTTLAAGIAATDADVGARIRLARIRATGSP